MKPITFDVTDPKTGKVKHCVALIRKLTERECFRLMGVPEGDIAKIGASGVSRSAQYKLAGNSIVAGTGTKDCQGNYDGVLFNIFRKMFIDTDAEGMQMSIFGEGSKPVKYNHEHPLRVMTLCSGYDSQCIALEQLKKAYPPFDYELVAWSEFDPETPNVPLDRQPAVVAHNALFPQWADRNMGDMTKIEWDKVPPIDLLFYSTPCQSISQAGLQHGFKEGSGTRSSIIWNVRDALNVLKPKYAVLENVQAMVSQKFKPMFNLWRDEVRTLGYENFAQVLNAKNYGTPQNRERIFLVSIRNDGDNPSYNFPATFTLQNKLKDVLEDKTDTKYYLNPNKVNQFVKDNMLMIEKYVREGEGEIEPLPPHLREWLNNYPEESDEKDSGQTGEDPAEGI